MKTEETTLNTNEDETRPKTGDLLELLDGEWASLTVGKAYRVSDVDESGFCVSNDYDMKIFMSWSKWREFFKFAEPKPISDRKRESFRFYDMLPEPLRTQAKENFDEGYRAEIPTNIYTAIGFGWSWHHSKHGNYDKWDAVSQEAKNGKYPLSEAHSDVVEPVKQEVESISNEQRQREYQEKVAKAAKIIHGQFPTEESYKYCLNQILSIIDEFNEPELCHDTLYAVAYHRAFYTEVLEYGKKLYAPDPLLIAMQNDGVISTNDNTAQPIPAVKQPDFDLYSKLDDNGKKVMRETYPNVEFPKVKEYVKSSEWTKYIRSLIFDGSDSCVYMFYNCTPEIVGNEIRFVKN